MKISDQQRYRVTLINDDNPALLCPDAFTSWARVYIRAISHETMHISQIPIRVYLLDIIPSSENGTSC